MRKRRSFSMKDENKVNAIVALYKAGMPYGQIGKTLDTSTSSVSRVLTVKGLIYHKKRLNPALVKRIYEDFQAKIEGSTILKVCCSLAEKHMMKPEEILSYVKRAKRDEAVKPKEVAEKFKDLVQDSLPFESKRNLGHAETYFTLWAAETQKIVEGVGRLVKMMEKLFNEMGIKYEIGNTEESKDNSVL